MKCRRNVELTFCLVCFVSSLNKGTQSLWGQVNVKKKKKMFKSISCYFHGFTILNYIFVTYSQNQLKLSKSKFIEHWSMSALLNWVVPEALVEVTASFFGRISSSLMTEREQPPCLHLAEQVSRECIRAASKTQSGQSAGNVRSVSKGLKAALSACCCLHDEDRWGRERLWDQALSAGTWSYSRYMPSTRIWKHRREAEVCPAITARLPLSLANNKTVKLIWPQDHFLSLPCKHRPSRWHWLDTCC